MDGGPVVHPVFGDFEEVEKDARSVFPHKCLIHFGNHSDLVYKLVHPRGFLQVE